MRRTTISRSEPLACVLACVVGALSAPAAQAQDSTTARPRTHIVAQGETLWSLAQQYYGDPLLWPEIYRLNTLVIEDPHWIFPGEELRLVPPDTTTVAPVVTAPAPDQPGVVRMVPPPSGADTSQSAMRIVPPVVAPAPPPPPTSESASTVFRPTSAGANDAGIRAAGDRAAYHPVYRGDFYSAGFLTENAALPWANVLGASGRTTLRNLTSTSSAQLFEEVALQAPVGAVYHVGDSLLVADLGREVPEWGRVVRPTGIVQVTRVNDRDVLGQVLALFGRVTDGAVALPLEQYVDKGNTVPIPIENGTRGSIITSRDPHAMTGSQQVVFVNLGRADGIVTGDMFEVLREQSGAQGPSQALGVLKVVHVRDHSCSTVVTRVMNLGIEPGATVRLIRKMPS
jgi:hypothetical protein